MTEQAEFPPNHPFPPGQGCVLSRKEDPDTGVPIDQPVPPKNSEGIPSPNIFSPPRPAYTTPPILPAQQPPKQIEPENVRQPIEWKDVRAGGRRGLSGMPRVRLLRFRDKKPTIDKDKWGKDRHQYSFAVEEFSEHDNNIVHSHMTTSSRRLLDQVEHEIDEYYANGDLFKRWFVLTREGEGVSTTYLLRSFDSDMDAHKHFLACVTYMRGRE